jgi:PAS domain S-box-containing protein
MCASAAAVAVNGSAPGWVRVVCVPSSDLAFSAVAEAAVDSMGAIDRAATIQAALRPLYPHASVRRRELSDEAGQTWYAYRDREAASWPGVDGLDHPDTAILRLGAADGLVVDANEAATTLFGSSALDLEGRAFTELTDPAGAQGASVIWALLAKDRPVETVLAIRASAGSLLLVESRGTLINGVAEWRYRLIGTAAPRA